MSSQVQESPEIIYEIYPDKESDDLYRYERVDQPDQATHELTVNKDPEEPDSLVKNSGPFKQTPMKKIKLSDAFWYDIPEKTANE
jgi:hypothetical protein